MKEHDPAQYGDRIAEVYDELFGGIDPGGAVELLADLAGEEPVLELGIGTGRLALPLQARNLTVVGIDSSEAMVAKLRAKPGGETIPVHLGDFADVDVEGSFSLAFVAFNTLFALLTQTRQLDCFLNVACRLAPGGRFVVEAFVPNPGRFDGGQRFSTDRITDEGVWLEAAQHDLVGQRVTSQHVHISEGGVQLFPVNIRYAWPSELDLMAKLAGLELEHRWGGWDRRPFGSGSGGHVSVWRKPDGA